MTKVQQHFAETRLVALPGHHMVDSSKWMEKRALYSKLGRLLRLGHV
jgi:hypothetical protein